MSASSSSPLSVDAVAAEVARTIDSWAVDGEQVVILVPDRTRTCPLTTVFPLVWAALRSRAREVVVVIALGTHEPLDDATARAHLGLSDRDRDPRLRIVNHAWRDEAQLVEVGRFHEADVRTISEGRLSIEVPITILSVVASASHVLVLGPVFPHEVAGFSGGNKYLFPGVAGRPIIDFFHWLGALITNRGIIGVERTPVREVLDRAAAMVRADKRALCMVVGSTDGALLGFFGGEIRAAWSAAVELSRRVHIRWCDRPFHTVVSVCPAMYPDLWTGGKCMYKLEPVVADGGELIIFAPHIREVSRVHGHVLERIGYHVRDYFVAQWAKFRSEPWGVLAHSTHVRGDGTFIDGVERPRVRVTLASGIDAAMCRRIGLGYRDPTGIDPESFADREREGVLLVRKAGEVLHRLR
jgi:nickel-dependent lactate racemase